MRRIYEAIQKYHMIEPGMRVLVGVSGGADSVCLLTALAQYREEGAFTLLAVHVEHGIRGAESLADASYVQELCGKLNVECVVRHVDVPAAAKERGLTVEEAGRTVRYEIFEAVAKEYAADRIAVAHNQNDQAETVMWNLVRGSGLKGLCGIRPVRDMVIRPLLFLKRSEIEEILTRLGIAWRTDRTNLETEYTRNRIRLQILPELEQSLNAQAVSHIAQAAGRLQEAEQYLEEQTEIAAGRCIQEKVAGPPDCRFNEIILVLSEYEKEPPLIQKELLKRCLAQLQVGRGLKDVGTVHLESLQTLCRLPCGKMCSLPGQVTAAREDGTVCFWCGKKSTGHSSGEDTAGASAKPCEIPLTLETAIQFGTFRAEASIVPHTQELEAEIQTEKKYTKWLSYDTINSSLCFRTRRAGDYLVVNKNGGRRKLKDYLIDQKIPRSMRDRLWLLADGPHILWVIGWRISEAAKVKQDTEKILKIQIEEASE